MRSDFDNYGLLVPLCAKHLTSDVNNCISGFIDSLLEDVSKLVKKPRKHIEKTVSTDFDAIDAFLCSISSKLSPLRPSVEHVVERAGKRTGDMRTKTKKSDLSQRSRLTIGTYRLKGGR